MKKILLTLMSLMFLFTACSKEESDIFPEKQNASVNRFYGVKNSKINQTKGIAQSTNLWHQNASIRVKFLNGSPDLQSKVKKYASEWQKYIGVTFDFVEEGKAEVRLAFDWYDDTRYVTWSYTGTDCKIVTDQNTPTANFAYFEDISEEEQKGDALRIFGQILGLELEHRHLDFDPQWKKNVQTYWEGNIEDIPWEILQEYVFNPLSKSQVVQTDEFDSTSIMIWSFPKNVVGAKDLWYSNYDLSEMDKEFIAQLYPKKNKFSESILSFSFILSNPDEYSRPTISDTEFSFIINSNIIIDWGDNMIDTIKSSGDKDHFQYYGHEYSNFDKRTINIYGDSTAIDKIAFTRVYGFDFVDNLDISKNIALTQFAFTNARLSKLDISKNKYLEVLHIADNNFNIIDISNNKYLRRIYINRNPIIENFENLLALANGLPDRTGLPQNYLEGAVYISKHVNSDTFKNICASKNWGVYFN